MTRSRVPQGHSDGGLLELVAERGERLRPMLGRARHIGTTRRVGPSGGHETITGRRLRQRDLDLEQHRLPEVHSLHRLFLRRQLCGGSCSRAAMGPIHLQVLPAVQSAGGHSPGPMCYGQRTFEYFFFGMVPLPGGFEPLPKLGISQPGGCGNGDRSLEQSSSRSATHNGDFGHHREPPVQKEHVAHGWICNRTVFAVFFIQTTMHFLNEVCAKDPIVLNSSESWLQKASDFVDNAQINVARTPLRQLSRDGHRLHGERPRKRRQHPAHIQVRPREHPVAYGPQRNSDGVRHRLHGEGTQQDLGASQTYRMDITQHRRVNTFSERGPMRVSDISDTMRGLAMRHGRARAQPAIAILVASAKLWSRQRITPRVR